MNRNKGLVRMVCAWCLLFCGIADAQRSGAPTTQSDHQTIIRSFDVSDLIRNNAQYPYDPDFRQAVGSSGRSSPQAAAPATRPGGTIQIGALLELIQGTVSADSWRDNGGTTGQIRSLGNVLVIEQTKENLDQVQKLLDELRRVMGPQQIMTVHATWVYALPGALPRNGADISDDWMRNQKVFCESQVTCFSGQTVHVSSGNDRFIVTDMTPVVASNAVAFDPTMQNSMTGVIMQVTPQTVPGTEEAIVDVKSIISLPGATEAPVAAVGFVAQGFTAQNVDRAIANGLIDRSNIVRQEFQTTARIPAKKRSIIGGMTINPAKGDEGNSQLYLVIEVSNGK